MRHGASAGAASSARRYRSAGSGERWPPWAIVSAAAARGQAPFAAVSGQIADGFVAWVDARLEAPAGADRSALAALVLGTLDGLVMLSGVGRDPLAQRAVEAWPRLTKGLPSPG